VGWVWGRSSDILGGGADSGSLDSGGVVHWVDGCTTSVSKCCSKLYWNSSRVPGGAVHYACGGDGLDNGVRAAAEGQGGGLETR